MQPSENPIQRWTLASGFALLLASAPAVSDASAASAAQSECGGKSRITAEYFDCEGKRLLIAGHKLRDQARQQILQSNQIAQQCSKVSDNNEAENCYLLSSDLHIDAGFKHAEAVDMLQEAERMFARAADLSDAPKKSP